MTEPLRVGLVGCGRLAERGYLAAFRATRAVRLVAVADPDPARRARVAESAAVGSGVPAGYATADELLDGTAVDAVVLATPAAAHVADAVRAAGAGVAVLVEKPPAPDAATAARLARLRPAPWVGFNRRFDPGVRRVRAGLPTVTELDLRLAIRYRRRSWGAHAVRDDALLDLAPHLVDLARWLGGGDALDVRTAELSAERAAFEVAMARGRATVRVATDRAHAELVEVRDRAGRLLARHRTGGLLAAVPARLRPGRPHPLVGSLSAQLDAFARAVNTGDARDLGTAADGAAAMATIDAARASAARGGIPTPVPHVVGSRRCS
ncbi:MAG: Gfo/Idh/MocA family protein [Acidimicrobiia bacterium]